jgi:hypothetical protein
MEWYERDLASDDLRLARWVIRLATLAIALFIVGWVFGAYIQGAW